jgi:hypothetical protein
MSEGSVTVTLLFIRRLIKLSLILIIEHYYQFHIHFSRLTSCVDVIFGTIRVHFDVLAQLLIMYVFAFVRYYKKNVGTVRYWIKKV